jgi:hypothetical protein
MEFVASKLDNLYYHHKTFSMKRYFYLLVLLVLSCQKSIEDQGCDNLIRSSPEIQLVKDKELDTVKYLMNKNKIDYSHLQFIQYSNIGFILIRSCQYVNGLKVFKNNLDFIQTKNDTALIVCGDFISDINQANSPSMRPSEIKKIFLDVIKNDSLIAKANLKIDTCVDLEFGYYDLNIHLNSLAKNFIRAWKINPKTKDHPESYISDENGEILEYFNGIYY